LSSSSEYFEPDYLCCEKLLGYKVCRDYSFVAHHMPLNRQLVGELLEHIEKRFNKSWYDVVIECFVDQNLRFSEYQLYGQYLFHKHKKRLRIRKLKYLQKYKLRYYPMVLIGVFDYIVFHSHKNPTINPKISRWKYNLFLKYASKKVE